MTSVDAACGRDTTDLERRIVLRLRDGYQSKRRAALLGQDRQRYWELTAEIARCNAHLVRLDKADGANKADGNRGGSDAET